MKSKLLYLLVMSVILSGCAGLVPQNPEEFKQSAVVEVDKNDVKQPYENVVGILKEKSEECLDKKLLRRICTNGNCMEDTITYTSTMVSGQNMSRLYVQMDVPSTTATISLDKQPEGGKILAVAEIMAIGNNHTKVDIYGMKYGWHAIPMALRDWTNGTNRECPDLREDDH